MQYTITEHPKASPAGFKWRKIGAGLHGDYLVQYWRNNGPTKHANASSLTECRKLANSLIRECSATYCEVYRYAENGASIIPVIQCSYRAI